MNISVTVMAHPKRGRQVGLLVTKLTTYPFKKPCVVWDELDNEWHTGERALRSGIAAGADWHVVLQDDAIIPDDFYRHLGNAISHVPVLSLISLYTGTARPLGRRVTLAVNQAKAKKASWLRHYMLLWGVSIALPTEHIEPMLRFVGGRKEAYDVRIGSFYQSNRLPIFYSNPSLVDHNDGLGSLLGHGHAPEPRVAHNFIDSEDPKWNSDFIVL